MFQDRRDIEEGEPVQGEKSVMAITETSRKLPCTRSVFIGDLLSHRPVLVADGDTEAQQAFGLEEPLIPPGYVR